MKQVIWKFEIELSTSVILWMPQDAHILTVQEQSDKLMIWALCDPSAKLEERVFNIVGTGDPFEFSSDTMRYIATVQQWPYVWHIFEQIKP